jgi:hypothetical protein
LLLRLGADLIQPRHRVGDRLIEAAVAVIQLLMGLKAGINQPIHPIHGRPGLHVFLWKAMLMAPERIERCSIQLF